MVLTKRVWYNLVSRGLPQTKKSRTGGSGRRGLGVAAPFAPIPRSVLRSDRDLHGMQTKCRQNNFRNMPLTLTCSD